ncbi:hypothetical protein PENTCL1PPCAC_4386, partial [Pristionchus entomophagus]
FRSSKSGIPPLLCYPAMCCCLGIRHGQLLLGFLALFCLFTNLNLIHLTSVLHPSIPDQARAFASLSSIHPGRFRREIASNPAVNLSKWDDGHPIANDEDGKGPIPVEKVTTTPIPTTLPRSTFLFSNPPTTPSTVATTRSTPSMKWPETTTEKLEEEVTEENDDAEDEVTQLINKGDPKRDVNEQKSFMDHWTLDTMLRLCFFACAGLGMSLACTALLFVPQSVNPARLAFGALLFSAFLTGCMPFLNFYAAAVARLLQGFCVSLCLPLASSLVSEWAPLRHRAFFLSFLLLAYPASILGPWPLAQLLSDFDVSHWAIYAIASGLSVVVAGFVLWRYKHHPYDHFFIKGEELSKIRAGKAKEQSIESRALPNHRSTSFWITATSFYGLFLALVLPSFYLPSLLANPELMWTWNLGVTAAIPYVAFVLLFYFISFLPYSSLSSRILNTIGLVLTGILFFLLPMLIDPERNILLPLLLLPLGLLSGGTVHLAVYLPTLRLLPSLSLSLFLAHFTAPFFVHLLVADNLHRLSWTSACTTIGILIAVCCAPFVTAAKDQLFPPKTESTLRPIDNDEECGLTELQELPPAGKHLS